MSISYMGSGRIFGCELSGVRGRGLGRHRRHCGGFGLFVREYHSYGGSGENIEGDVEALIISR